MKNNKQFEAGKKVIYKPKSEPGIIKSIRANGTEAYVTYDCAGNWKKYHLYTGKLTQLSDLKLGWETKEQTNE